VVAEHLAGVLADLVAGRLAAVEADRDAALGEQGGEGVRVALVPGVEEAGEEIAGGVVWLGADARLAITSR
jgi:alanine dehydrogenase